MANLMNSAQFMMEANSQPNMMQVAQQAMQNPAAFEEQFRRMNPQAYQQALQIRNSPNAQSIVMQMVRDRGINPNIFKILHL